MRREAYLRVASDEATVRFLHERARNMCSTMAPSKAPLDDSGYQWWTWKTPRTAISESDTDADIKGILSRNRELVPLLQECRARNPRTMTVLQLVTSYAASDRPSGLSLEAETISLLNSYGAGVDDDAILDTGS